jgi:hypothetical protein
MSSHLSKQVSFKAVGKRTHGFAHPAQIII